MNVEARGTRGPSLLFQTSPGDAKLIDLYAAHVSTIATSSLYAEIYKFLPNDTDLTLFINDNIPSYNFAFSDNVRYYHSPLDLRRNLNLATLQMHGDNLLGVVTGLEETNFSDLKDGNDVYLSIFGQFLPRVPESWALPLAIVVFLLLAIAAWFARSDGGSRRSAILSILMPPSVIIGCGILGWALALIAQALSGHPDPTYAHPVAMRLSLSVGVFAVVFAASRMSNATSAAASVWLWMSGLGVVVAALLPGFSPYFVFPSMIAAVLLLAAARTRGGWGGTLGQLALLFSSLVALVVWLQLVVSGESLMGLRLHPLFTLPAALGLMTAVPLFGARPIPSGAWRTITAVGFVLAIAGAVVAGFRPAYSAQSPQRIDLIYFENEKGDTRWIAGTSWKGIGTEPIPPALTNAGHLKLTQDAYPGLDFGSAYTGPAGAPRYPLPVASLSNGKTIGAHHVTTLAVQGSSDTDGLMLYIPKSAKLVAVDLRGQHIAAPLGWSSDTRVLCLSRDCRELSISLTYSGNLEGVEIAEERYAFPPFGEFLKTARPADAMASQSGDQIVLANALKTN